MSGIFQIIRNFFLRVGGFFSVFFGFIANSIKNLFAAFARLFGLTQSDYFLESNEAQGTGRIEAKQQIEKKQNNIPETPTPNRRRANAKVDDYFLNMAREVKKD
ncbi:threonine dehydratase [Brunnivagina elsteri]|uniref:Threonine dehydratase n=1 Tax=Brunnivagina elsteri CCALA 953 TaxID=987040 RepID=A0A2A2TFT1_9CYAN|nr:threonine dehydratase [Calothrix elsteri]PAX52600.1 threonine dehydratase [Calothrix elsteri CCALA 953]